MSRSLLLVLVAAAAAACAPKEQPAAQPAGDSTVSPNAFTDSAAVRDSIGAAPGDTVTDSMVRPPAGPVRAGTAVRDSSATKASAIKAESPKPTVGPIIGRDSAFGPTFTVDSTGKVTPIVPPRKKP